MKFTAEGGDAGACPAVPSQTVTISSSQSFGGSSSMPADGGQGCTSTSDMSTCTVTQNCTTTSGTFTTTLGITLTYGASSIDGKETIASSDSSSMYQSNCTYDITTTKN